MKIKTIDIDLAKNVFQIHGVDSDGKPVQAPTCGQENSLLWVIRSN
jgi:hypothetical protein